MAHLPSRLRAKLFCKNALAEVKGKIGVKIKANLRHKRVYVLTFRRKGLSLNNLTGFVVDPFYEKVKIGNSNNCSFDPLQRSAQPQKNIYNYACLSMITNE